MKKVKSVSKKPVQKVRTSKKEALDAGKKVMRKYHDAIKNLAAR